MRETTAQVVREQGAEPIPLWIKYLVFLRIGFFLLLLGGIYWLADTAGVLDQANPQGIRDLVAQWGALSVLVYLLAFVLGQLVYVPGMVFVVAGSLAFGGVSGFVWAMLGAMLSVTLSFFVARFIGGTPLADPRRGWVKRLVRRLDERPVSSIFVMRTVVSTAPWLNYMLGMSSVNYRDYFLGSALGMLIPVALTVIFTDWLLAALG